MQLERSYFRHLKVKNKIYEFIFIARIANKNISLAGNASRPQYINVLKCAKI